MAITLKVLRFVSIGGGTTFQVNNGAASKGWLIKRICFHNPTGSAVTLDLSVSAQGGTTTYLCKGSSLAAGTSLALEGELALNHLGTGDKLSAFTNGTLDCVVDGIERDQ